MLSVIFLRTRQPPLSGRLIGIALAAALSTWLSLGGEAARAAPVTSLPSDAPEPTVAPGARTTPKAAAGGSTQTEVSTGNRNLDLLLDMQGRAGEIARAASRPASAAKIPVALPNTNLSGGVVNEIRAAETAKSAKGDKGSGKAGSVPDLLGAGDGNVAARPNGQEPTERREWRGQVQGNSSGMAGGSWRDGGDGVPRAGGVAEPEAMRMLRETIDWMRQNRWQVLGMLLGVVALAALVKFYTRRPAA